MSFLIVFAAPFMLLADHDEAIDGDLSGDRNAPTVISVTAGSNVVNATSVRGDLEYFSITVPPGHELTAVNLTAYPGSRPAFLALQEGAVFTETANGTDVTQLLGWTHLGLPLEDKLPVMASQAGVIGYTPPLAAGTYTFWSQETSFAPSSYTLDFVITALPSSAAIPTLSEWSIIVLMLSILIVGLVAVRSSNCQLQY